MLSPEALATALEGITGWTLVDGQLSRTWQFKDFAEAMAFVNRVAEAAEAMDHHPDIHVFYNRVRLDLVTHSAGGITALDIALASKI